VVAWDYQIAQIVVAPELISSLWETRSGLIYGPFLSLEITMDEMLVVCKAVRRGVKRAWSAATSHSVSPRSTDTR